MNYGLTLEIFKKLILITARYMKFCRYQHSTKIKNHIYIMFFGM